MKWFRSNIGLGSRLALFALAIQFLLSFGHFHGGGAQAASASLAAERSGLHDIVGFAASLQLNSSTGDAPIGQPGDDCAICATIALANTMVDATPPYLLAPQATALGYLTTEAGFADLNSARVAFQPRAPPIA